MLPDFSQFEALAQQGNFIPVYREWIADLDTPVSAWYRVCAGQPYNFLLESVEGGEHLARYSLLGCDPVWVLETQGQHTTQTHRDGSVVSHSGNPFQILQDCLAPYHPVHLPQLPSGIGGLVGFWGYELINWIEPRVPIYSSSASELPDGLWMQVDNLMIFDQVQRKIWVIAYADLQQIPELAVAYQQACDRVEYLVHKLQQPLDRQKLELTGMTSSQSTTANFTSNVTQAQFCQNVQLAKDYIKAGDISGCFISAVVYPIPGRPFRALSLLTIDQSIALYVLPAFSRLANYRF